METPTAIWSWPSAFAGAIVASLTAIFGYLIKRKKLPAEVHKTEADADLTAAQADDLRFKTRLSATEMFSEMAADLGELQFEKLQLKAEILRLTERNKILEVEVQRSKAERMLKKLDG
jgi:hypothetical protein